MTEKEIKNLFLQDMQLHGYTVWFSPSFKFMRWDIFGIFDAVVVHPQKGVHFVQLTTASNMAARRKKILNNPVHSLLSSWLWAYDLPKARWKIENLNEKAPSAP